MFPDYLNKELDVLFFIATKKKTSTDEVSKNLFYTKRAIRETISTINQHFEEYRNINKFILLDKTGLIQIQPQFRENALSEAYAIKLLLLKTHTIFNYTVLLLTRASIHKDVILEELYVSSSYLNKLTQQLNNYFATFY